MKEKSKSFCLSLHRWLSFPSTPSIGMHLQIGIYGATRGFGADSGGGDDSRTLWGREKKILKSIET